MKVSKKKLNVKSLGEKLTMQCWKDGGDDETGHYVAIARFFGVALGVKGYESKFDDGFQNAFLGSFEGINLVDGTAEQGSILFLPDLARMAVEGALAGNDGKPLKIDITIGVERAVKQDGSLSFTYVVEDNLGGNAGVDPLAEMRAEITKQLNAPASARAAVTDQTGAKKEAAKRNAAKAA